MGRMGELTAASRDGRLCCRGSGKHGGWQKEAEILPEISLRENTLFHTVTRVNFCSSSLTGGNVGHSEEHTKSRQLERADSSRTFDVKHLYKPKYKWITF